MVFVSVCENDALNLFRVADQIRDIVDDEVYAEHIVVGKSESAVDDENIIAIFKHGQVFSDLAEAAERNDTQFFEFSFRSCHRVIPFFHLGFAIKGTTKNLEHVFLFK